MHIPTSKIPIAFKATIKHCSLKNNIPDRKDVIYRIGGQFKAFVDKKTKQLLLDFLKEYDNSDKRKIYYK